ncbi:MAG: TIM barrel protein [Verrucomicrobiales bacterium]|nr:TIM barrel protein [Verrucomicrobiales bacterium]
MSSDDQNGIGRRVFLNRSAAVTAAAVGMEQRLGAAEEAGVKGAVNHSVCKWCYPKLALDDLCEVGKQFGLKSVELLMPDDFATLRKHGMTCAMVSFPTAKAADGETVGRIEKAWNRPDYHDTLVAVYEAHLKASAAVGAKQVICFSGNRDGMDDEVGLENCAAGLKRILPLAEKLGVTVVMELLNSKVNHADYMCDHSGWGVALCEKIGSENFKLLYDIYHMQIMEGDVIATIRRNHRYFSHYHTGGVPGRHEIDETQELYYPAIMRAIVETGYEGYVAQEFVPAREDVIASLRQGVEICDV